MNITSSPSAIRSPAPGPGLFANIRLLSEGLRAGPGALLHKMRREHGDIARFRIGVNEAVLVTRPDLIRRVLVEEREVFVKGGGRPWQRLVGFVGNGLFTLPDGAVWRQRRVDSQPFFTKKGVADYAGVVATSVDRLAERWSTGATVDLGREMVRVTMDIICQVAMGVDMEDDPSLAKRASQAISDGIDLVAGGFGDLVSMPQAIPTPKNRRALRIARALDEIMYGIIERRRAGPGAKRDYLGALLEMRDVDRGLPLDARAIRDELVTMFIAGHETTASLLTWLWYTLSTHPDVEARVLREVDETLGGRAPTSADLGRLPYLAAVVHEALRMYPPLWVFVREAARAHHLGGYRIDRGNLIIVSPWFVHHDARWFPDPERFLPERFLEGSSPALDPTQAPPRRGPALDRHAYFPFGAGPRTCIGNSFALMEAMVVVARVAQRFRIVRTDDVPVEPDFDTTLRPKRPIAVRFVPRARA